MLYLILLRFFFEKTIYLFIFRQKGKKEEREREKHQCVVASRMPPPGDLACHPGMWPDWESNWQPFGSKASAQSIKPHQPEIIKVFFIINLFLFSSLTCFLLSSNHESLRTLPCLFHRCLKSPSLQKKKKPKTHKTKTKTKSNRFLGNLKWQVEIIHEDPGAGL